MHCCVFTEADLQRAFVATLGGGGILPAFSMFVEEVPCRQGVADVVALQGTSVSFVEALPSFAGLTGGQVDVLAHLEGTKTHNLDALRQRVGFSGRTVKKICHRLVEAGFARGQADDEFVLERELPVDDVLFWAFELKLANWKRALFQALQNAAFADYSCVVFPVTKRNVLERNLERFERFGVGVLLIDVFSGELTFLVRPRRSSGTMRSYRLSAVGGVARQVSGSAVLGLSGYDRARLSDDRRLQQPRQT